MVHGAPDWRRGSGSRIVFAVTDLGELAARLGSIDTFDRGGDVFWLDDFESSLNSWATSLAGTGAAAAISTASARNGGSSVALTPGSDGGLSAAIQHEAPLIRLSPMGFEFSFTVQDDVSIVEMYMEVYDGGPSAASFRVRWVRALEQLQVWQGGAAPAWATVQTGVALYSDDGLFNTMKLVGDPDNGDILRVVLNQWTPDVSAYERGIFITTDAAHVRVGIIVYGTAAANPTSYVDDVILTLNEPT